MVSAGLLVEPGKKMYVSEREMEDCDAEEEEEEDYHTGTDPVCSALN